MKTYLILTQRNEDRCWDNKEDGLTSLQEARKAARRYLRTGYDQVLIEQTDSSTGDWWYPCYLTRFADGKIWETNRQDYIQTIIN